jgi:murein DD-endopeptidase MepM/ murein hydrolase activator NlpD
VGSPKNEFDVSASSSPVTPVPLTRREARALWEKQERLAAKAAKKGIQAPQVAASTAAVEKPAAPVAATAAPVLDSAAVPTATETTAPTAAAKAPSAAKVAKSRKAPKISSKARAPRSVASDRRRTGRVATMIAMAFVAGFAVASTVPANALLTAEDVRSLNFGVLGGTAPGQEVQASGAATLSGRDKVAAAQYEGGGLEAVPGHTYINNPGGKIQYPIRETVPITDVFGWRRNPFGGSGAEFHRGIDFNPGEGHPIQAIADGVVSVVGGGEAGMYSALGYYVTIDHNVGGHLVQSTYAHMLAGSIQVKLGQKVRVTDIIGQVGSTGASTGAHLHFGLEVDHVLVDPWPWLQAHAK